jgi:hypothetical protein
MRRKYPSRPPLLRPGDISRGNCLGESTKKGKEKKAGICEKVKYTRGRENLELK